MYPPSEIFGFFFASFDGRDHKETVLFVIKASHRVHHLSRRLVGRRFGARVWFWRYAFNQTVFEQKGGKVETMAI